MIPFSFFSKDIISEACNSRRNILGIYIQSPKCNNRNEESRNPYDSFMSSLSGFSDVVRRLRKLCEDVQSETNWVQLREKASRMLPDLSPYVPKDTLKQTDKWKKSYHDLAKSCKDLTPDKWAKEFLETKVGHDLEDLFQYIGCACHCLMPPITSKTITSKRKRSDSSSEHSDSSSASSDSSSANGDSSSENGDSSSEHSDGSFEKVITPKRRK